MSIWKIWWLESDTYYWINADYHHKARCTKPKAYIYSYKYKISTKQLWNAQGSYW